MSEEIIVADESTMQHIVINQDRSVAVPSILKKSIVQHDHNIERLTFDCPRYWYGKDISALNIYVNYISVSQKSKGEDPGSSLCENVVIDENDQDILHFDWIITDNVSEDMGGLIFLVCAKSVDSDGNEDVHWNSHLCKEMEVQEGLEASSAIVKRYPDVIESILSKLGKQIELRNSGTAIQYRNAGENTWVDLVQLEDIRGEAAVIIESNFQGSDTTANIIAKTGETGDKWYSTDDGVYYMFSSKGEWINCGSGENLKKIEDEITEIKGDISQISEEMENLKSTGTGTGMELEDGTVTFKKLQSITYNGESTTESLVVNLFNKNAIEYGSVEPNGTLTRNGNTDYERIEIAIEGGKKYTMSAIVDDTNKLPSMYMAMLDYDKNILFYGLSYGKDWRSPSNTTTTSSEMTGKVDATGKGIVLSTTADCAYFRFMTKKATEFDITDVFMFEEGEICHDYVDYVSGENPDDIQTLDGCEITKIFGANLADTKARNNIISLENYMNALLKQVGYYSGKKWAVLGDSVSYYTAYANNKLYHQVIGSDLGFEVINLSEGNRGFSAGGESNFLNGQVPKIPEDVDLITIMGSINDASLASNLGEVTDTGTDTYCGIIYNTLMTIIKDHPNAALGVMTDNPIVGNENHSKVCGAIESVCNHYGVPCLNLNKHSGIYPNIDEAKAIQMHDDVHPNEVGHALMAAKIKPWIKTLL